VPLLVVFETGIIVAFVEVFEHGREDFRLFIGKVDALVRCLEELVTARRLEERGMAEDVFMGGKEPLLRSDRECDDGTNGSSG
jgi:hypothetical protein